MPVATFPAKYIRADSGSIVFKFYASPAPSGAFFFKVGPFTLIHDGTKYSLTGNGKTLSLTRPLPNGYGTLLWSWEKKKHLLSVQDASGTEVVSTVPDWQSMVSENLELTGKPIFTGSIVLLEIHLSSLVEETAASLRATGDAYLSAVTSGVLDEEVPQERNHAFSEILPTAGMFFGRDFRDRSIRYLEAPYLEATPAPIDHSPILVKDEEGPLRRQYFFDLNSSVYTDSNTEVFLLKEKDSFTLSYSGLDPKRTPLVEILGEQIPVLEVDGPVVLLNLTPEEHDRWYGEEVSITYWLDRSYSVEWNEEAAYDSYLVRLNDRQNKPITITQEGNRHHQVKLATEIELNPILNSQHTGFLYIDTEEQHAQAFRLNLSSSYLMMDGMDSADFIVELIDQHGNEILSPYLDVFVADKTIARQNDSGTLVPILTEDTLEARNRAGRCYFRYRAPIQIPGETMKEHLFLVAYDRKSGLGAQIPLRLRQPLLPSWVKEGKTSAPVVVYSQEGIPEAMIPFEYFARYYNRPLPKGHPLEVLDEDKDGMLTRADWLAFQKRIQDRSFLAPLSQALIEQEEF